MKIITALFIREDNFVFRCETLSKRGLFPENEWLREETTEEFKMVKKKVDPRVRGLIEHGVRRHHRSLFILVGDHGKDQVENLHRILSKTRVQARPSVLWCYKKELGFSSHRKKRMKEIKKSQARGLYDPERDDPFELFISSTNIRWTYYKETDKILGQTFGMCVLQDFEAITPNVLARTIETVEGGGLVIILMKSVKSLKQLYTMTMDVHSRFRTEAHHEVIPRFNERFILSLGDCSGCLVLDDELNILPISSKVEYIPTFESVSEGLQDGNADISGSYIDPELKELKMSLADTPIVSNLVELTKTIDQGKVVLSFLDAISEKTLRTTVSLTASRGRGKSAAIGLCLAGSIAYGYSNVFVTAPSPENLKTVFEFLISGLKMLKYTEHMDFEVIQEHSGDAGKVVVRVNVFRNHRQTVQYILPSDHMKLSQAELVAIDEAAAIPLPTVKKLLGPYLVFMSSTINGYEGTGRSLSLKLIQQLRTQQGQSASSSALQAGNMVAGSKNKKGNERNLHEQRWKVAADAAASYNTSGASSGGARALSELILETPIRYGSNDPIERWLNGLLCLDAASGSTRMVNIMPAPRDCELYVVDRDALFSFHELSEALLQRIWALYTAAHYKNSPNDLQMLSDAPAHRLFVLLGPQRASNSSSNEGKKKGVVLPDVLCVVQVAFEGMISQKSVQSELSKGHKASGDLIPWIISQQFNDSEFAGLSGARVVRIATHPDVQSMGYGSRAIDLLISYFQGELTTDTIYPSSGLLGGEGKGESQIISSDAMEHSNGLLDETVTPKAKLPPLLTPIADRPAERLHWFGSSFGLTPSLLNFWTKKSFKVCYVRQTCNELTGEFSSIVLRELNCSGLVDSPRAGWVEAFVDDYRHRLVALMSYSFSKLESSLAITLLDPERQLTTISGGNEGSLTLENTEFEEAAEKTGKDLKSNVSRQGIQRNQALTASELLSVHLSPHDMKRLELYARNMVDHHMILDTLPTLAKFLFERRLPQLKLSYLQVAIILGTGLQHKDVDAIALELDLPVNQVLAFFNKTMRKISNTLREMVEKDTALTLLPSKSQLLRMEERVSLMETVDTSLAEDQQNNAKEFSQRQNEKIDKMQRELIMESTDLRKHAIGEAVSVSLDKVLQKKVNQIPSMVSIPKGDKMIEEEGEVQSGKKHKLFSTGGSGEEEKTKKKKKKDRQPK